jgi:hypothetical protein
MSGEFSFGRQFCSRPQHAFAQHLLEAQDEEMGEVLFGVEGNARRALPGWAGWHVPYSEQNGRAKSRPAYLEHDPIGITFTHVNSRGPRHSPVKIVKLHMSEGV